MLSTAEQVVRDARDEVLKRSVSEVRDRWEHDARFKRSIAALEGVLMGVAVDLHDLGVRDSTVYTMAARQFHAHVRLEASLHRAFASLTEEYDRNRPRWVGPPLRYDT